jgi:hypothetical protein
VEPIAAPVDALARLAECLLLSFAYASDRRQFTLVTDYPIRSTGSIREFAGFRFDGAGFEREPGDFEPDRDVDHFQSSGPGAVLVQAVTVEPAQASLWFGPNFGGFTVTFGALSGWTRGSIATEIGPSTWQYRDTRTGEPFDFHRPFPTLGP